MVRIAIFAGAALLGLGTAAPAQQPEPALDLSNRAQAEQCRAASEAEIVVCAERGPSRYRIDPDVLQSIRAKELADNPPRKPSQVTDGDPCTVGPNGCPGEGALPLMSMALTAVTMAVKGLQGEDWREPLRTGPDDYQRYLESKRKREGAGSRVSIGVGISNDR